VIARRRNDLALHRYMEFIVSATKLLDSGIVIFLTNMEVSSLKQ